MRRWPLLLAGLAMLGATVFGPRPSTTEAQTGCVFQLGFRTLHDMIPDIAGQCIENEWHNAFNGDGLQRTTTGMMVWRKIDNWTAFTNGYQTWINGPFGLQSRLNTERFSWENPLAVPGLTDAGTSGGTDTSGAAGGGAAAATATPTPVSGPSLSFDIPDRANKGESFTVRLRADADGGVESMWWWATDTDDNNLRNTHTFDCGGASPCRQTWDVSTNDTGDIKFHARAKASNGQTSDESNEEIEIRDVTPTPTPTPKP